MVTREQVIAALAGHAYEVLGQNNSTSSSHNPAGAPGDILLMRGGIAVGIQFGDPSWPMLVIDGNGASERRPLELGDLRTEFEQQFMSLVARRLGSTSSAK